MDNHFVISRTCGDELEMSSTEVKKAMQSNRECLMKIIKCLQFFCRQGQALQGHADNVSNFIQLLKLRAKYNLSLSKWLQQKDNKYQGCHGPWKSWKVLIKIGGKSFQALESPWICVVVLENPGIGKNLFIYFQK